VQKTLKRLEDKMQGRVLQYLIYLMRTSDRDNQQRIAVALAHLCSEAGDFALFQGTSDGGCQFLSNRPSNRRIVPLYGKSDRLFTHGRKFAHR